MMGAAVYEMILQMARACGDRTGILRNRMNVHPAAAAHSGVWTNHRAAPPLTTARCVGVGCAGASTVVDDDDDHDGADESDILLVLSPSPLPASTGGIL